MAGLLGCDDANDPKEWVAVSPGAVDIAIVDDGRFVGKEIASGVVQAADDRTRPWSLVPGFAGAQLVPSLTRRPLVVAAGHTWVTANGGWTDLGPTELGAGRHIVAVDAMDRWVVSESDGSLSRVVAGADTGRIYTAAPGEVVSTIVSPAGRVYGLQSFPDRRQDLLALDAGTRTSVLGTTGCTGGAACSRGIRIIGFDGDDRLYAAIFAPDTPGGIPIYRYDGSAWKALPAFVDPGPEGQVSCAVNAGAAVYCLGSEDIGDKLFRIGDGDESWSDLGIVPSVAACALAVRDDGQVAMRCETATNGNNLLYVSTK